MKLLDNFIDDIFSLLSPLREQITDLVASDNFRQWVGTLATPLALVLIAIFITKRLAFAERELSIKKNQQEASKNYLDIITKLLIDKDLASQKHESPIAQAARAIVVSALRELDYERRIQFLEFLSDAKLIQKTSLDEHSPTLLRGVDLSAINLRNVRLRKVDLSEANLSRANLDGANLAESNLRGINLASATLKSAWLDKADLHRAFLVKAELDRAILQEVNLEEARMDQASLRGTYLGRANLADVELSFSFLEELLESRLELEWSNRRGIMRLLALKAISLSFELLKWGNKGANLAGADLSHAVLRKGNFRQCNLSGCNLVGCDLTHSCLDRAKIDAASLVGANLSSASLEKAVLRFTLYDGSTSFPDGYDPKKNGMVNANGSSVWDIVLSRISLWL
ncbi:pentapeptide repeat-containing protein [Leptolyngbya sp. FACHB-36]|uniref:pentapeptide repeat-containing protein n=1 Tax=Leptolyngbya sp. FACHB-36 TaxID=2692808 RepID=UPI00167FEC56|nr:pentapeptide repeat-containing protein [Leptolyngbya sp. FACHB-36]MBD2019104.1 pentapeptide repeat-containing protein [Leptolyngbya sp. FACHB-36]